MSESLTPEIPSPAPSSSPPGHHRALRIGAAAAVVAVGTLGIVLWATGGSSPAASRPPGAKTTARVLAAAPTTSNICPASAAKLTVTGSGLGTGVPNLLTLTLDVVVTQPNAQQALAADSAQSDEVIAALKAHGDLQRDIQTSDLSVQPQYNYPNGVQVLTGYQVDETVTAEFHQSELPTAGAAVDAASKVSSSDVRIDSLVFSVDDPRPLENAARVDAVHQATGEADALAAASGEKLGPICSLTDQTQQQVSYNNPDAAAGVFNTTLAHASPTVPVSAGTLQETAQVSIVYSLVAPSAN